MTQSEQPEAVRRGAQRVGSLIKGKYKLEKLLGAGGMASVYEATHRNGIRVAVKILHPEMSHDPEMCQRFLREGYVANKVGHKGAVRVLDDDVCEDGAVFLVMELLEGDTLDERWEKSGQRLPAKQVLDIGHQLLDILASAHAQQIVHRDIKPDNIFLTRPNDTVNVLDFGIARLREGLESSATATRTGRTMGTPAFMPHEQALGRAKEVDHQTDIWAVGATLFTLLTGRHVHEAESVNELLVFAATKRAPKVATLAPSTPSALAAVIDRALEFDKIQRWPDARSMQVALDECRAAVSHAAFSSPTTQVLPATSTVAQASAHDAPRSSAVSQEALAATVSSSSIEVARAADLSGDFSRNATMASGDAPIPVLPSTTHVGVASSRRPDPSISFLSTGRGPKTALAAVSALLLAGVVYAAFLRPTTAAPPPVAATGSIAVDPPVPGPVAVPPAPSAASAIASATTSAAVARPVIPVIPPVASVAATPVASTPAVVARPHPPAASAGPVVRKPPTPARPASDPFGAQ
ncbi:MAG: protein kinase [Polyangiaceae bacterium]